MPDQIELDEGRGLFGLNPGGYDAARPDYPSWIYERLGDECALGPNCAVLEIGAGNGLATGELLKRGADPLTVIEPDIRFAASLETLLQPGAHGSDCRLLQQTFEAADLAPAQFDLVAAATSFHWIDQPSGLRKVAQLLRAGGFVALWWNVFQDLEKDDAFHQATRELLVDLATSPSGAPEQLPFALDRQARETDLRGAGFTDLAHFQSHWTLRLTSTEVGQLYEGFSPIQRLPDVARSAVLDELMRIADAEFGGQVERNMTSCLYLAQIRE